MIQKPFLSLFIMLAMLGCVSNEAFGEDRASQIIQKKNEWHKCLLEIYKSRGSANEVCTEYGALCSLNPTDARLHYEYANYLWKANRVPEAKNAFRKLLQIDPSGDNHGLYGDFLNQLKDYQGALNEYSKAGIKYQPKLQIIRNYLDSIQRIKQYNEQVRKQQEEGD